MAIKDPKNASIQDIVSAMSGSEQAQGAAPEQDAQMNPVIDALKTIQMFISSVKESNPDFGAQQEAAFKSFVSSLQNKGPAPQGQSNVPPQGEVAQPPMPAKGAEVPPKEETGGRGVVRAIPMNAKAGATQIM